MRDWLFDRARLLVVIIPILTFWMVGAILTRWRQRRNAEPPRGFDVTPTRAESPPARTDRPL